MGFACRQVPWDGTRERLKSTRERGEKSGPDRSGPEFFW